MSSSGQVSQHGLRQAELSLELNDRVRSSEEAEVHVDTARASLDGIRERAKAPVVCAHEARARARKHLLDIGDNALDLRLVHLGFQDKHGLVLALAVLPAPLRPHLCRFCLWIQSGFLPLDLGAPRRGTKESAEDNDSPHGGKEILPDPSKSGHRDARNPHRPMGRAIFHENADFSGF